MFHEKQKQEAHHSLTVAQMNNAVGFAYGSGCGCGKLADPGDILMIKVAGCADRLGLEGKEREPSRTTPSLWHEQLGGLYCHEPCVR